MAVSWHGNSKQQAQDYEVNFCDVLCYVTFICGDGNGNKISVLNTLFVCLYVALMLTRDTTEHDQSEWSAQAAGRWMWGPG